MAKLEGEFEVTSWDEDTYPKLEGERKLTKASVTQKFTGDLAGDSNESRARRRATPAAL